MSAPTMIDEFKKSQLETLERFTIRHADQEQRMKFCASDQRFDVHLDSGVMPVFFDPPVQREAAPGYPRRLRARRGVVIVEKRALHGWVAYDLVMNLIYVFDKSYKLCWQSAVITAIAFVVEI